MVIDKKFKNFFIVPLGSTGTTVYLPVVWYGRNDANCEGDYFEIDFEESINEFKTIVNKRVLDIPNKISEQETKANYFQNSFKTCLELRNNWLKLQTEQGVKQSLTCYLENNGIASEEAKSFTRKLGSYGNRLIYIQDLIHEKEFFEKLQGFERDLYNVCRSVLISKLRVFMQEANENLLQNTRKKLREHYEDVLYSKASQLIYWAYGKMLEDIHEVIGDDIAFLHVDEKTFACKQLRSVLNYIQFNS